MAGRTFVVLEHAIQHNTIVPSNKPFGTYQNQHQMAAWLAVAISTKQIGCQSKSPGDGLEMAAPGDFQQLRELF